MNFLLRMLGLDSGSRVDSVTGWHWEAAAPVARGLLYVIVAAGLMLAVLNFLPRIKMRASTRVATFLLRLSLVGLVLVLLQRIEASLQVKLREPQRWLVVVDDSASMATADVGGRSRYAAARADVEALRAGAGRDVEVDVESLSGAALGEQPGKGPTVFRSALSRSALTTVGAGGRSSVGDSKLIFLTDGRDTEGRDLSALGRDLKARGLDVVVCLYGSQAAPKDSAVFAEPEQSVIRLGEELVIRCTVAGAAGRGADVVTLKENGKPVKEVSVPAESAARGFTITHKPARAGRYRYAVALPGADTLEMNNSYEFLVEVVEEKIKVLIIEGFPRYEFKLMKAALEVDPLVELCSVVHIPGGGVYVQGKAQHSNPEQGLISSRAELFKYDVVFLRDVSRQYFREGGDTTESRLRNIVEFVTKRGGGLVVLGGQDVFRAGGYEDSALAEVLPFDLTDYWSKEPQFEGMFFVSIPKTALDHPILRLLADPVQNRERLHSLRQLDGSNNVGRFRPLATPLLTRMAKLPGAAGQMREHEVPIMAYQAVGDGKVVAAAVDTLWRWELQADFEDPPLQALLANVVRYVAPPPRSRPGAPGVRLLDPSPQVGQQVALSTTLKDRNYEPIRNAELKVTVAQPDGSRRSIYPRDLPEQPGYYEYKVDVEMPGEYSVLAQHGKEATEAWFVVEAAASEFADLSTDREGMNRFMKAAGGKVVSSGRDWARTADKRPRAREAVRDLQVWNSPLMMVLFVALVCADCYLRKRQGLP